MTASKFREWIRRYGPAELVSTVLTLLPGLWLLRRGERLSAAVAATWLGNAGYFGMLLAADIRLARRQRREQGERSTVRTFGRNLRALAAEFGVAELLDSLLVRPALLYWVPVWTGHPAGGLLLAKLLADVAFYVPAAFLYEWSKRRGWRDFR